MEGTSRPPTRPDAPVFVALSGPARGARLAGRPVGGVVKRRCADAGLEGAYTGHSLRRGSAQRLSAAGEVVVEIMAVGRWKSPMMVAIYTAHDGATRSGTERVAPSAKSSMPNSRMLRRSAPVQRPDDIIFPSRGREGSGQAVVVEKQTVKSGHHGNDFRRDGPRQIVPLQEQEPQILEVTEFGRDGARQVVAVKPQPHERREVAEFRGDTTGQTI